MFYPKLFYILKNLKTQYSKKQFFSDLMAGVIVAIIALPLSVALAIASGVTPEKGLITAIVAGFLISLLGGSRVQIGGPTGAFVVIVYEIIKTYGLSGLIISTVMAGIILIVFGILKFGSMIKFFPYPITVGFTSGIAVVLMSTQIKDFFGLKITDVPSEFFAKWEVYIQNFSKINYQTVFIGILSLLIIFLWQKFSKKIPGSLVAVIVSTIIVGLFKMDVATIGSVFGELSSKIPAPAFSFPDFTTIKKLMMPSVTIAMLAAIESLLSAVVADGMIGKRHNSNTELIAQGVANIGSALFGGIPATGAIARTAANIKNGGRTPIAGIVHSVTLLLIMLIFMPYAKLIPMCTLSAILISVAYNMSEWKTFLNILKSTKSDISVMVITFLFTIIFDLVFAIEVGMIIAAFLFMKRMADVTEINFVNPIYSDIVKSDSTTIESLEFPKIQGTIPKNVFIYEINGPLFFGAINTFLDMMDQIQSSWDIIIFRMKNVPAMDASAFNVLERIYKKCKKNHILLMFTEVREQPMKLLNKVGFSSKIGNDKFFDNIDDAIFEAKQIIEIKNKVKKKRDFSNSVNI